MGKSETDRQNKVRICLSKIGITNWRNNVGMMDTPSGGKIKFGLCKGSSDVIGLMSVEITPEMVGKTVAVFVACEVKAATDPTEEQLDYIDFVNEAGGLGFIAKSVVDVCAAVEEWRFKMMKYPGR